MPTVSRRFPWQHSRFKSHQTVRKKETQNGRCWIPYMESHQRESRSWGSVMSGNWSRGIDQGRVGPALVACSSLLISHLLDPTLMIWGQTCPLSYSLYPSSLIYFIIFVLTFFSTYFMHMETLLEASMYTVNMLFLISPHFVLLHNLKNTLLQR